MGAASMATTLLLLLLLLLASFVQSQSQWSPQDVYRIDCGASSSSTVDGLQWEADGKKYVSTGTLGNATTGSNFSVPYSTARIFTSSASYSFPVTPGRHWVRLHFFPSEFESGGIGLDPSNARFSVSIGSHVLVSNASIVEEIQQQKQQQPFLMREFSIHAASTTLSIEFVPSGGGGGGSNNNNNNATTTFFAFISGIEVVSMAHDAISPSVIQIGKEQSEQLELPSTAIQSMYRLNVGGSLVTPANDSSDQGRIWVSDESFLQGVVKGVQALPAVAEISYPSGVPEYIAPRSVYGTARTLGSANTATNAFNLSWIFPVDAGFSYYVRLHFAELVYASPMQRVFSVYINNQTALRGLDISQQVPLDTPYYRDFVVPPAVGLGSLRLQIGPTPNSGSQYQDAILNGVEIFKLNDTAGNVDGLPVAAGGGASSASGKKKKNTGLILGAAIGGAAAAAMVLAALLLCGCRSGKGRKKASSASSPWQSLAAAGGNSHSVISSVGGGSYYAGSVAGGGGGGNGRYFTFQEISEATGGFDESRLLGVGGFGRVYKGEIDGGTVHVAVKRGNPRSEQGVAEFHAEIGVLSKLRHRHLVSLIGYCDEGSEMILVYEYMAQGPLRGHLYGTDLPPLTWRQRLDVCVAAARGLHYLHTGADMARAIIHRDVKTTNILLDEHYVAKVSDFGLSKTGPMLDQTHVSTAVKGSFGYLDPEYFRRQQLTDKSDVYSFGVVLVEVMCARPAIDPALPREQVNIAEWAMQAQRAGRLEQILDPYLLRGGDGGGDEVADMASVRKVGETAQKCLAEQGVERPSMGDVLWNLECALQMQEAAERRRRDGGGGGGAAGSGGGNNVVEMVPRGLQNGHVTGGGGGGDAEPNNRRSVSQGNGNHDGDDEDYDDDDVYSEDASASAVFSQLVNPQGR